MPFIPHTQDEVRQMLDTIGVEQIDDLFGEIPPDLQINELQHTPDGMDEMAISRIMRERAAQDGGTINYIGAGAYEHHIPAAVWEIASRGEFYSAYTPYQAEASQGGLQLLYEYQTMMASLMAMEVSNASLYDGASALAEAILMAVRVNRQINSKKIIIPSTLHPRYRQVVHTLTHHQGVELLELGHDEQTGLIDTAALAAYQDTAITAMVINQPNFFGRLESPDYLTDWAHKKNALVIAVVNPLAMALIKPPGQWGKQGADIACGEGQPLGVPLSSGGPYYGFLTCRHKIVRQLPGRLVGKTVDQEGQAGYVLTLQTREQHIRRSKATSNICTNQGLMVTASTIHMAILGASGLRQVAMACHANLQKLLDKVDTMVGVANHFRGLGFHEAVLQLDCPVDAVLRVMSAHGVQAGYDVSQQIPNGLLVCVTETRTDADIERYANLLERVVGLQSTPPCPIKPKWS